MTSIYQQIFFGHCYSCNNFVHKSLNCKSYEKFRDYKKNASSNKPKVRNHKFFAPLQRYDIEGYKCNNHGHIERDCKLMTPIEKDVTKEFQDKKQRKDWKKNKEEEISMISLCAIEKHILLYIDSGCSKHMT